MDATCRMSPRSNTATLADAPPRFTTATPKTLSAAIERIGDIYQAVAIGELDQEKGDRLVGYIDKLVKAIEVSELEKRLKILEDKANGKQA